MNSRSTTRRRRSAAIASAALAATALSAVPASGTLTGPGVREGSNITVFHNIDFVAAVGYGGFVGNPVPVTVEVFRKGVLIGSASGPAIDAEGQPGLEVNHGPEGAPVDGDCWEGHTPDVQPGDVVRVTDADGTDQVTVDRIRFTGAPFLARNGDVVVRGFAKFVNGQPIPIARLDSAEFRDTSKFRGVPDVVARTPGRPAGFTMRYHPPYNLERNRIYPTVAQRRQSLLGDGHAIGFGHVDPLPPESMLVDGVADAPGPAPGCEELAPSAQYKVTGLTPSVLNKSNTGASLQLQGTSFDASQVNVTLSDADGTTRSTDVTPAQASGAQTWAATLPAAALRGLSGRVKVATSFTIPTGELAGPRRSLLRDVVSPRHPTATPRAGTYRRAKMVALRAEPGARIRYTLGQRSTPAPSATSGRRYRGNKIRIAKTKVLKMIAIDQAGNTSRVFRQRYRIR